MIIATDLLGKEYIFEHVLTAQCTASLLSPAVGFAAKVVANGTVPDLYSLAWKHDGETKFVGICDKVTTNISRTGTVLTLEGRNAGAYLIDNEALPASYYNVLFEDIQGRYFGAYGGIYSTVLPRIEPISSFAVHKGMSDWDALGEFCKRAYGTYPYMTTALEMELLPPINGKVHIVSNKRDDALHFLSFKRVIDRSSLISKVLIRDSLGAYPYEVLNPEREAQKIRRKRYFAPQSEYEYEAYSDASDMIKRGASERHKASVVLDGIHKIELGDRIQGDYGDDYSYMQLMVVEVRIAKDSDGERTELELIEEKYAKFLK